MHLKTKILVWCFAVVFIYQQWSYASIDSSLRNVINAGTSLTNVQPLTGDMRNSGNGLTMMQQVPGDIRGGAVVSVASVSTNYVPYGISSNGLAGYWPFDSLSGNQTDSYAGLILTAVNSPTGSAGVVTNSVQTKQSGGNKYFTLGNNTKWSYGSNALGVTSGWSSAILTIGSTTLFSIAESKWVGGGNRETEMALNNNNPQGLQFEIVDAAGAIKVATLNLPPNSLSNTYLVSWGVQTNTIWIATNMGPRVSTAISVNGAGTNAVCGVQIGAEGGANGWEGKIDEYRHYYNVNPVDGQVGAIYSNAVLNHVGTPLTN